MSKTQIFIFIIWITSVKTDDLDFNVVSTSPQPLQQRSEISDLEKKLRMLQEQNERILQQLETISSTGGYHQIKSLVPRSCKDVQDRGPNVTNFYFIKPDSSPDNFAVVCDMERRGGGWTYLLNRFDGSQDFSLGWDDYKNGFGNLFGEFWLGLDNIHHLTGYEMNELLVELVDFNGTEAYAHYDLFSVGGEGDGYSLKLLGGYEGTAGDSLNYSVGMKFTTRDRDQDLSKEDNCAIYFGAPWWYKDCMRSLLTGKYDGEEHVNSANQTIYWRSFRGYKSLKQARMMVRPRRNLNPILLPHDKSK